MSTNAGSNSLNNEGGDRGQISITLPDPMLRVIDEKLHGTIGTSRSDAIRTALAIYLAENGLLDLKEALPDA